MKELGQLDIWKKDLLNKEMAKIIEESNEPEVNITLLAQPHEFSFRIDDTGIFDAKDKTYPQISTAYQDNAKIVSISVMDLPAEENETASALAK